MVANSWADLIDWTWWPAASPFCQSFKVFVFLLDSVSLSVLFMPYCLTKQKGLLWNLDAGKSKNIPSLPSTTSIFGHKLSVFFPSRTYKAWITNKLKLNYAYLPGIKSNLLTAEFTVSLQLLAHLLWNSETKDNGIKTCSPCTWR